MHHDEIAVGWTVYDSENEKVGDVADVGSNFVLVQKGLIFIKDLYIPPQEIAETDAASQRLFLKIPKSQVDQMGWEAPVSDGVGSGTTDAGWGTGASTASGSTSSSGSSTSLAQTGAYLGDEERERLTLHEEELQAQTRREQAGEVTVSKRVVEEQQALEVPVTHEEVEVRRVRVDREAGADDTAFTSDGETIRVPVTAETVEVTKEPRVVEEIEISKRPVTERQRVTDTVRREEADISQEGDVTVGDASRELVGSGADRMERTNLDDLEGSGEDIGGGRGY